MQHVAVIQRSNEKACVCPQTTASIVISEGTVVLCNSPGERCSMSGPYSWSTRKDVYYEDTHTENISTQPERPSAAHQATRCTCFQTAGCSIIDHPAAYFTTLRGRQLAKHEQLPLFCGSHLEPRSVCDLVASVPGFQEFVPTDSFG